MRMKKWEKKAKIKEEKKKFTCPYCQKIYKNKNEKHLLKCAVKYKGQSKEF